MNYDEALEAALNLAEDPAGLEAFLSTVPAWAGQLRREVRLAGSIGSELRAISPSADAASRRQQELLALISRTELAGASPQRTTLSTLAGFFASITRPRLLITATFVVAVLVLVLLGGFPALSGNGPVVAEAVVIEGSVSEVGAGGVVTINTAGSAELVKFSSDTVLTDGFGNPLQASDLNAGQTVILKGSRSDTGVVASQVELKDRLFGTITALSSASMSLRSGKGDHFIRITPDTEIEGPLAVGFDVEVKVLRLTDGTLRALEIESEDDEHEGDEDHNDGSSSGSASPIPPLASPSAGTTPGPGASDGNEEDRKADDDHEDTESAVGEEHDNEPSEEDEEHHEDETEEEHESEDD